METSSQGLGDPAAHSSTSVHHVPLPVYPSLHLQSKEPTVSVQSALRWQLSRSWMHSRNCRLQIVVRKCVPGTASQVVMSTPETRPYPMNLSVVLVLGSLTRQRFRSVYGLPSAHFQASIEMTSRYPPVQAPLPVGRIVWMKLCSSRLWIDGRVQDAFVSE